MANSDCIDELNNDDNNLAIKAPEIGVVNLQSHSEVKYTETPPHDGDDDKGNFVNEPDSTVETRNENIVNYDDDDDNIDQNSDDKKSPFLPRFSGDKEYNYTKQELTTVIKP